jgi:hypothetical protein
LLRSKLQVSVRREEPRVASRDRVFGPALARPSPRGKAASFLEGPRFGPRDSDGERRMRTGFARRALARAPLFLLGFALISLGSILVPYLIGVVPVLIGLALILRRNRSRPPCTGGVAHHKVGDPTGPAGVGAVLRSESGEVIGEISKSIGVSTNTVADYTALIEGLEMALDSGVDEINAYVDSGGRRTPGRRLQSEGGSLASPRRAGSPAARLFRDVVAGPRAPNAEPRGRPARQPGNRRSDWRGAAASPAPDHTCPTPPAPC